MAKKKRDNSWLKHPAYRRARNYMRSYKRFNKLSPKSQARSHRQQPDDLVLEVYKPHKPGTGISRRRSLLIKNYITAREIFNKKPA